MEGNHVKPNYLGIVGAIIAFVSLALPWWTVTLSAMGISYTINLNLFGLSGMPTGVAFTGGAWYMWLALVLVVVGGVLGLVGSVTPRTSMLTGGGALTLISIIVFALGLQMDISSVGLSIFGSGTFMGVSYSSYLSFGLWIALVAAIIMFVASRKKPVEAVSVPSPP